MRIAGDGMEYKVIIQENMGCGNIYMHNFALDRRHLKDALRFRSLDYHSDCVFIAGYSNN